MEGAAMEEGKVDRTKWVGLLKGIGIAAAVVAGAIGVVFVLAVVRASTADGGMWIILAMSAVALVLAIAYVVTLVRGKPKIAATAALFGAGLSVISPAMPIST